MIDSSLDSSRVNQLAASLGCPADMEAITEALLRQTTLGQDEYAAVWSSVDHLVRHDTAWRSMVSGVVPPSLRAQALAVTSRTSPTAPADSVPAVVLAAIGEVLVDPPSPARNASSDARSRAQRILAIGHLPRFSGSAFLHRRALSVSRIRHPDRAANLNS